MHEIIEEIIYFIQLHLCFFGKLCVNSESSFPNTFSRIATKNKALLFVVNTFPCFFVLFSCVVVVVVVFLFGEC